MASESRRAESAIRIGEEDESGGLWLLLGPFLARLMVKVDVVHENGAALGSVDITIVERDSPDAVVPWIVGSRLVSRHVDWHEVDVPGPVKNL
jgi:hypothetical protein